MPKSRLPRLFTGPPGDDDLTDEDELDDANHDARSAVDQPAYHLPVPSSPIAPRRRPATMSRRPSNSEAPPDERSPLLTTSRSRIRLPSAHDSPRTLPYSHLSRDPSYTGPSSRCLAALLSASCRAAKAPILLPHPQSLALPIPPCLWLFSRASFRDRDTS
jgi:hypothetical protein